MKLEAIAVVMRSLACVALAGPSACSAPAQTPRTVPAQPAGDGGVSAMIARPPAVVPPMLRLPNDVRPTRYAVELTVVPTLDTFEGKATIALELGAPTTAIWMHAANLTVTSATIWGADGKDVPARAVTTEPGMQGNDDLVAFVVDQPLGRGAAELVVTYQGQLSDKEGTGAFRRKDGGEWYVYTHFEATHARRVFPCFDEPSFKVPFALTLRVRSEHVAVANAPAVSETASGNGMKTVRFADTKPLPTYLIAFGVGPFEIVHGGKAGKNATPLRTIVPKGRSADVGYATRITPGILLALEDYFGTPYPYEKLDQIAVPGLGFAMENAGLVTYDTERILIRPDSETIARKRRFASVATHELAHHWFGNLVTLAWWDDLWLNEAFASWMEHEILMRLEPAWSYDVELVHRRWGAMRTDSLATARKIRQPIETRHDIPAAFDTITYQKGALTIAMFARWIGPEKFQRGLKRYFAKHAHGTASTADFLAALSEEAGVDVVPPFTTFLDQVGTPLVSVELDCKAAPKLVLSQQRYVPIGSKAPVDQTWKTPICVKFDRGKSEGHTCTLLESPRGELVLPVTSCPRWVLANETGIGYYRVHYKGDLLDKLFAFEKRLTVAERVGMYDDLVAVVESGHVPVSQALERLPALAKERNRHLTTIAYAFASLLSNDIVPKQLRPNRARLARKLFGGRARANGWRSLKGEDDDTRLVRPMPLWWAAHLGEDPHLIATAKQLADDWITDRRAIDPDLITFVLAVSARNGDRSFFDRLRAAAKAEKSPEDRDYLLGAMGSFRDPAIAKDAMQIVLSDEFEARDSIVLVLTALNDENTRELAYQFVKANLDALLEKLPRNSGARFIGIGARFCDAAHRDDAAAFFKDKAPMYLNGARSLAHMIERADVCIAKKRALEAGVSTFLKRW